MRGAVYSLPRAIHQTRFALLLRCILRCCFILFGCLRMRIVRGYGLEWSMSLWHRLSAGCDAVSIHLVILLAIRYRGRRLDSSAASGRTSEALRLQFLRTHWPEEALSSQRRYVCPAGGADRTMRAAGSCSTGRRRRRTSHSTVGRLGDAAQMSEAMLCAGRIW